MHTPLSMAYTGTKPTATTMIKQAHNKSEVDVALSSVGPFNVATNTSCFDDDGGVMNLPS